MAYVKLGTWKFLFGFDLYRVSPDPYGDLNLTSDQRAQMDHDAIIDHMDFAEELLQSAYPGIYIEHVNGDVLVDANAGVDIYSDEWDELAGEIKLYEGNMEILDYYIDLSHKNDEEGIEGD